MVCVLLSARHLVAVCARHDGQDGEGSADSRRGARLPGVYESRGCGAAQGHAADYVREVSAVRDGAGRGAPLGAGVCRDRQRSAAVVCGAGRLCWQASIRFSFRVRCTAWRPICTRSSCRPRARVRAVRASVEVAAVAADSPAADLAAVAEARFRLGDMPTLAAIVTGLLLSNY